MHNSQGVIIKGVGGLYTVTLPGGTVTCTARGLFRKQGHTPLVGDHVIVEDGIIKTILQRKNELRRPRVANVDQVLIVCAAAQPELSVSLLNRYLIQAENEEIPAIICVNKIELARSQPDLQEIARIFTSANYPVFLVSVETGHGIDELSYAFAGKTTVLAGQSGVGKSSLINLLAGTDNTEEPMEVGTISKKIGRGKHTTRHAQILPLSVKPPAKIFEKNFSRSLENKASTLEKEPDEAMPSGFIIDTPGFSSIELPEVPTTERANLMREFAPYLNKCKFTNCLHAKEIDCAVKEQVGKTIDPGRYNWYLEWINNV